MARLVSSALSTPLGDDLAQVTRRRRAGESAARPNPLFDASSYRHTLAAPVLEPIPKTRHDRVLRRMGRVGHDVAMRAVAAAPEIAAGPRLGLWVGVGGLRAHWDEMMPALAGQDDDFADSWQRGLRHIHPFWMLRHLSNNTHALLSADLDARGEGVTFGGASADAQAVAAACDALDAGTVDAAVVLAYDSLIDPETLAARRDSFVPGEAAAAMVLARDGDGPKISAATGADGREGAPGPDVVRAVLTRLDATAPSSISGQVRELMGDLGAASAMVTALCAIADRDSEPACTISLSVGAPGLVGAIRVDHSKETS